MVVALRFSLSLLSAYLVAIIQGGSVAPPVIVQHPTGDAVLRVLDLLVARWLAAGGCGDICGNKNRH